jgi:uncharacterized protein
MVKAPMIIDCHCHAGKGDGLTGPWDTDAPLADYVAWAKEAGIQKTVLFAAFHSDYNQANRAVARIVNKYPNRFYGFAFIHPARDRGRVYEMVKKAVQEYKFCGIKVHRYDARITREICETAQTFQLPILYDVLGEVSVVELLATQYPKVNFIIPHLGSFADDWKAQMGLIDHLVRHPNVYTDTSGIRRFDILKKAFQRVGAHKILFGSDGPWLHPGVELAKIRALHLPKKEEQLVLAGNFLRLIANVQRRPSLAPTTWARVAVTPAIHYRDPWLLNQEIAW